MNKKGQAIYLKLALGLGFGAYIGYSIAQELGAVVGMALGAYLAMKV